MCGYQENACYFLSVFSLVTKCPALFVGSDPASINKSSLNLLCNKSINLAMHQVRSPSHDNAATMSMTSSAHQQLHPRINNTLKISLADSPTSTAFTCQKKVKQSFGCHFFSIDFLECSVRAGERSARQGGRGGRRKWHAIFPQVHL